MEEETNSTMKLEMKNQNNSVLQSTLIIDREPFWRQGKNTV